MMIMRPLQNNGILVQTRHTENNVWISPFSICLCLFVSFCFVLFWLFLSLVSVGGVAGKGREGGGGKNGYEKMSRTYCFLFNFFQTNIIGLLYEGFAICNLIVWF